MGFFCNFLFALNIFDSNDYLDAFYCSCSKKKSKKCNLNPSFTILTRDTIIAKDASMYLNSKRASQHLNKDFSILKWRKQWIDWHKLYSIEKVYGVKRLRMQIFWINQPKCVQYRFFEDGQFNVFWVKFSNIDEIVFLVHCIGQLLTVSCSIDRSNKID